MKADSRTLDAIFGMTRQLVVPLFQRPYVWNEEDNWTPLWEAIRDAADSRLHDGNARPHFLGAIVLDQMPTATGDIETRQIIDGQQRLTTLQLFLAAVRDTSRAAGAEDFVTTFDVLTRNQVPGSTSKIDRFKVWPTNRDRDAFCTVIGAESGDAVRKAFGCRSDAERVGVLLADAYLYFVEQLADWLQGPGATPAERLKALYRTLVSGLILVVIDLGEEDDAQLIFETLNALGQPLLPADLVKNFLFHKADRAGEAVEDLYREYWAWFDEESAFWRTRFCWRSSARASSPQSELRSCKPSSRISSAARSVA